MCGGAVTQAPDAPRPSGGHDSSLVPILTNQRDRYRRRGQELEEVHAGPGMVGAGGSTVLKNPREFGSSHVVYGMQANRKLQHTIDELKAKLASLQDDNVKLYEKIRFLQDYRGSKAWRRPAQSGVAVNPRYF